MSECAFGWGGHIRMDEPEESIADRIAGLHERAKMDRLCVKDCVRGPTGLGGGGL